MGARAKSLIVAEGRQCWIVLTSGSEARICAVFVPGGYSDWIQGCQTCAQARSLSVSCPLHSQSGPLSNLADSLVCTLLHATAFNRPDLGLQDRATAPVRTFM